MQKKSSDYLVKGLVVSLILIVINLIGGFTHLQLETWFRWTSTILPVIALIIVCIQYGKEKKDGVTFGNVFGYGFKVSLFIAALITVYTAVAVLVIFPEMKDQAIQQARANMEAKGNVSEDQIETALSYTNKLFVPIAIIGTFLGTLIMGIIGSLLGAAFAKKSEPNIFQDNP